MSDSLVLKSLEDGILTLTVNRPNALNALNRQVIDALAAAIEAAQDQAARCGEADSRVSSVILDLAKRG